MLPTRNSDALGMLEEDGWMTSMSSSSSSCCERPLRLVPVPAAGLTPQGFALGSFQGGGGLRFSHESFGYHRFSYESFGYHRFSYMPPMRSLIRHGFEGGLQ